MENESKSMEKKEHGNKWSQVMEKGECEECEDNKSNGDKYCKECGYKL